MVFVTLFPNLENVHLIKDVGMIPYVMYKDYGYDAYVAGYGGADYSYFKTDVIGLKWLELKRRCNSNLINGILFLIKYARKIDVLNLYHYQVTSFVWTVTYKMLNPKGKVFLKLDINTESGKKMTMKKGSVKWLLTKYVLGLCKIVSCESVEFQSYTKGLWPIRLTHLTNGVLKKDICPEQSKEKIIMTVGRLGTKEKATERLIEAFENAIKDISNDWKLYLVGSMTDNFKEYLTEKIQNNEGLKSRTVVAGEINDRKKLAELYRKCVIFSMPSVHEGFSLATIEALAKGCYLLLSDLQSFREISMNEKYGRLFEKDDMDSFTNAMIQTCQKYEREGSLINYRELQEDMQKYSSWESICEKLDAEIKHG